MPRPLESNDAKYGSLRIPPELSAKMAHYAALLPGTSINSFGVSAIEAVIRMVETAPVKRTTPTIVLMLDSVKGEKPSLRAADEDAARLIRKSKGET